MSLTMSKFSDKQLSCNNFNKYWKSKYWTVSRVFEFRTLNYFYKFFNACSWGAVIINNNILFICVFKLSQLFILALNKSDLFVSLTTLSDFLFLFQGPPS